MVHKFEPTTRALQKIVHRICFHKRFLRKQIRAVKQDPNMVVMAPAREGHQSISALLGNVIDELFKDEVERAAARGELPPDLKVTVGAGTRGVPPEQKRGPDAHIKFHRVAWDVTTAEQGREHVERDVLQRDPDAYDLYYVLAY
jgi:hypothetical protein